MIEANLSFRVAVRGFVAGIKEASAANRVRIEDIAWFIPHQANLRMFQNIASTLKIPFERFYLTLHKYGNISSASCAISLDEAVRDGSVKKNDLICLPVFGGGLTWGSALIRW
jgi:3-oxoacyl-[acyl-carrier-protein] synthase-3